MSEHSGGEHGPLSEMLEKTEVCELYFVEDFEAHQVATIIGQPLKLVLARIASGRTASRGSKRQARAKISKQLSARPSGGGHHSSPGEQLEFPRNLC
jgi:hypothetical protein